MSGSLRAGTRLGTHRIVAPLGVGGMGEVYRAHDSKLDRAVALKILPAEVVKDAERVRRFVQEAKSASSLSHPNIVHIYDIGEAVPLEEGAEPAADAAEVHYIAMELVEGATLRQLFDDRSVEPRTLLSYLAQAAEGLAKAHAAGIVHRDLKPENIMVTRDGYAKVLDFGLAKLTEPSVSGSALATAPTALQEDRTKEGAVIGTIGYMSPEQTMGKPVDHRTDLFAFGCLLYEAATGRKPFTGESNVDILHAIVREKPAPVEEISPQIPSALVRTIRRCLAKDPERRYQSMKDLALELHETAEEWETLPTPSGTVTGGSSVSSVSPPTKGGPGRAGWIAIAVAAVAVVVAITLALRPGASGSASAAGRPAAMKITTVTANGAVGDAALSADGRYLAYTRRDKDGDSLWLRQIATSHDVELVAAEGGRWLRDPTFTPDGSYVVYTLSDETHTYFTAYRIGALGGTPRKIAVGVDSRIGFSPDGKSIAFLRDLSQTGTQLLVVAPDGTGERVLTSRKRAENRDFFAGYSGLGPSWSPDGRTLAVAGVDTTDGFRGEIVLADAASGAQKVLGDEIWYRFAGLQWTPDGHALIVAGLHKGEAFQNQIWRIDASSGRSSRITNDTSSYQGVSLSGDGRWLASTQVLSSSAVWRRDLDAGSAEARRLTSGGRQTINNLEIAGDGTLFFTLKRGDALSAARLGPGDTGPVTITPTERPAVEPQVSQDGRTVVVRMFQADGIAAFVKMDRDGGNPQRVGNRIAEYPCTLAPDGSVLATHVGEGIWIVPIGGGKERLLFKGSDAFPVQFSPDSTRLLFYQSQPGEGGRTQQYGGVIRIADGAVIARFPRPAGPVNGFRWAPDGKALTVLMKVGGRDGIYRWPLDGGKPSRLASFDDDRLGYYVFSADGKTLYYTLVDRAADVVLIENFQ